MFWAHCSCFFIVVVQQNTSIHEYNSDEDHITETDTQSQTQTMKNVPPPQVRIFMKLSSKKSTKPHNLVILVAHNNQQ